jgi:hypothetical protein
MRRQTENGCYIPETTTEAFEVVVEVCNREIEWAYEDTEDISEALKILHNFIYKEV